MRYALPVIPLIVSSIFIFLPTQAASREGLAPGDSQRDELSAQWSGILADDSCERFDEDTRSLIESDEDMADFFDDARPAGYGDSEMGAIDLEGSDSDGIDTEGGDSDGIDTEGGDSDGIDMEGGDSDGIDMEGGDTDGNNTEGSDTEGIGHQEESDAEDLEMRRSGSGDRDSNSRRGNLDTNSTIHDGSSGEDGDTDDTEAVGHNSSTSSREKISRRRFLSSLVSHRSTSFSEM